VYRNNEPIKILIASREYIVQSGMKAIIQTLDVDADIIIAKDINELKVQTHRPTDYLIIHSNLIEIPKAQHFQEISHFFKGQIMVMEGDHVIDKLHHNTLLLHGSRQQITEQLQTFLAQPEVEKKPENDILSVREIEILKEVALGYSNKEIADRLFISINTVITHRKNLTDKLGIKTISGLTVYALMNQLIDPTEVTK
jgi:DNA-binding CsgD family transcriptional regulator